MSKIVLFGATGYTGRLTAEALVKRGQAPLLVGRNPEKLAALACRLGDLPTHLADLGRPTALAEALDPGDVLVTTVGPFTLYGETALEAAVGRRVHYLDSTGEPGFVRRVFEDYGPRAQAAGCLLLTAGGYDYVPGHLAAAVALAQAGPAAVRVDVGYFTRGGFDMSQGTRGSTRVAALDPGKRWRDGRLVPAGAPDVRDFELAGKIRPALGISSSEHYSLPRLYPQLQHVNTYLGWFGKRTRALARAAKLQAALLQLPGVRATLEAVARRSHRSQGEGPGPELRVKSISHIVAEAFDAAGHKIGRADLVGANGYDYTAAMLAWMAETILLGRANGTGARGPLEAFGFAALRQGCREAGLNLEPS